MSLLFALLLAAVPPPAGEWMPFPVEADQGDSFYDSGSVERDGDLVRVLVRVNPNEASGLADQFHEARLQSEIDCAARTTRLLNIDVYAADGALLGSEGADREMEPIRDGHAADALSQILCPGR